CIVAFQRYSCLWRAGDGGAAGAYCCGGGCAYAYCQGACCCQHAAIIAAWFAVSCHVWRSFVVGVIAYNTNYTQQCKVKQTGLRQKGTPGASPQRTRGNQTPYYEP